MSGCSFIGARVPKNPTPDHHCPTGVVIADGVGTAFFLIEPTACVIDGALGGFEGENDGLACVMAGVPLAIVGSVYLLSTIYGSRAHGRCERRKGAYVADVERQEKRGGDERVRAAVVGDAAMVCAVSEPDVGPCFADDATCAAEVKRAGGACEAKQETWCFDMQSIVGGPIETTCAVSRVDCDARRIGYTRDASLVVTTCGSYTARAP
ncbi:MAG TPA: hypothetical protein VMZ53_05265 [Kofleriaceae bacterium]|nr:hypothetical protein [Kofleriaceae bacterium]